MYENDIKRCAPDDPNRCQYVGPKGQCGNLAQPDMKNCLPHGGVSKDTSRRTYSLTRYKMRLEKFADDPKLKSLNEEIGIIRMMLEEVINRCENDHDLIMQSGQISDMVMKVSALVTSCDRLDQRRGQLLDKSALLRFASAVVDIISDVFGDDERVVQVADRIMQTLGGENDNVSA